MWPRNYPRAFGEKLVALWSSLTTEKQGMPALPEDLPPATVTFESMDYGDKWSEANLVSVCHYLRAGSLLNIPANWRGLMPVKL